jgi:hypothetical protein
LIIGAIFGAAIGAAVWVLVQFFFEREFGWLAVGIGLLAGLFAKAAAGKASLGYARGAVPAIATLLFIISAPYALFGLLQATGGPRGHTTLLQPRSDSSSAGDSTEQAKTDAPDPPTEMTRGAGPGGATQGLRRAEDPFSWTTFLWIGIAALAAYVLGGSDPAAQAEMPTEDTPEAAPPVDSPGPTPEPPATEDDS